MANDEFSKTTNKALEHVSAGAAATVGTFLAGPGGAVAGVVVARTAVDWFQRLAGKNDEALYEARLSAVEDWCRKLDERMRSQEEKGVRFDADDFLTREATFSEFAKGVTEARTPGKREALVNAAARQFDAEAGTPVVREYWLRKVRELPDIELDVVKLVHKHGRLAFDGAVFAVSKTAGSVWLGEHVGTPTRSEVVALEVTALNMSEGSEPDQLLLRDRAQISIRTTQLNGPYENKTTSLFGLTPSGEELAKFIAD